MIIFKSSDTFAGSFKLISGLAILAEKSGYVFWFSHNRPKIWELVGGRMSSEI